MASPDSERPDENVSYIPFGVSELDGHHRGLPTGSTVLLAGAPDAGGTAFTYTSLARLMLAKYNPNAVPERLSDRAEQIPENVTYVTLAHDREHLYSELRAVLSDVQFETLTDHLTVVDFSHRFLELLPIPPALFAERRRQADEIEQTEDDEESDVVPDEESFQTLLNDVSARLAESKDDLLVVDSLSDLRRATQFGLENGREIAFLAGLHEAVVNWGTVAYVMYQRRAASARSDTSIQGLLHGGIYFYSNDHGFETYRTMRVGSFGGALDSERQTVFESYVGDSGFRAKATKKIGPSRF
jgi:KaiC/GvpD/RAD55 family RecA-like ATPase